LLHAIPVRAADVPSTRELTELSLEELSSLEITSVSKKAQPLSEAPASIYVITGDEIRRSGATTLPEALRLAPNLQVAQVSAGSYSITARGMYNTSANKLLVLIDGRSVYSPLFAGVFWDVQDVMLQDVDRIEVISGPGGTLWGVNAVNGVVNVITKPADATRDGLIAANAGNRGGDAAARYGMDAMGGGAFRIYAKYDDRSRSANAQGQSIPDAWYRSQAGFRGDWHTVRSAVMVEGNAYRGLIGQPPPGSISISGISLDLGPIPVSGANALARASYRLPGGSEALVQAYYDRTERTVPPTFAEKLDIVDVQAQHNVALSSKYSLVWGGEVRRSRDRLRNSAIFGFLPAQVSQGWDSLFAQGEARISDDARLIVGARAERNDYTGWELLPSARLAWSIAPEQLLWLAASRVVRAPTRLDRDAIVPSTPPFLLAGGSDAPSEIAKVYEVGYRGKYSDRLSYSATLFHSLYERLHTQEIAPSGTFLTFSGRMSGTTTGMEAWATWQVTSRWRISPGFTVQRERFRLYPGSNDLSAVTTSGRDPSHQWLLRSSATLRDGLELDATLRSVAALTDPVVPAYSALDVRLGWHPTRQLEMFVAGRNVADAGHGEFADRETRAEIGRSVYAGFVWQFGAR
jgi:iron complex outermembrane receptor protein